MGPLLNMSKGGCENKSTSFIFLIFHSNKSQNSKKIEYPIIEVKKEGGTHEINVFF